MVEPEEGPDECITGGKSIRFADEVRFGIAPATLLGSSLGRPPEGEVGMN